MLKVFIHQKCVYTPSVYLCTYTKCVDVESGATTYQGLEVHVQKFNGGAAMCGFVLCVYLQYVWLCALCILAMCDSAAGKFITWLSE